MFGQCRRGLEREMEGIDFGKAEDYVMGLYHFDRGRSLEGQRGFGLLLGRYV